jgi:arylsulfatase A
MRAMEDLGVAENTLVFFTSDNGPWHIYDTHGGSSGLLRGAKGMTWEGGMRVPALAWWPGVIPGGKVIPHLTSTMDLLPTALALVGREAPADRIIDGKNLLPLMTGETDAPLHETFFYYRGETLYAARKGPWKAHFITQWAYEPGSDRVYHDPPELYQLDHDPSEQYNVADSYPDIIEEIRREVERHDAALQRVPSQLEARIE